MSTHILDAFLIKFGLETSEFEDGERDIRDRSKRLREDSKKTFDGMEAGSKKFGSSIKNVRNEVVGLGLAFMGARSITDMIGNMMTGAASAERLGNTMGMTTRQVWSWRQAMKGVGGQTGDADAALQSIQRLRMAFKMGQIDPASSGVLARLGIGGGDLRGSNPGDILRKLSGAQSRMDPELFSSLLSQIGLSGPVTYFLMKGQGSVDKLLKEFEASADGQEELAKKTEDLQVQMADLNTKIQGMLVPVLVRVADGLDKILSILPGGGKPETKKTDAGRKVLWEDRTFGGLFTIYADSPAAKGQAPKLAQSRQKPAPVAAGRKGGTRAERNNNPGNIEDGGFARKQPGYVGGDGRFAKFDTVEHGTQAMVNLLSSYMRKGKDTIGEIVAKWAPPSENDTAGYIRDVEKRTGIGRHQQLAQSQLRTVAVAMARHEGFRGDIKIQHMTVQTKDAASFQRDMRAQVRRHTVAKADQGVAP